MDYIPGMTMEDEQSKMTEDQIDFANAFKDMLSEGVVLTNTKTANDPEFISRVYNRLNETGNHPLGNIVRGAELDREDSNSMQSLVDQMVPDPTKF